MSPIPDWRLVEKAKSDISSESAEVQTALTSLPPGYIRGFDLSIDGDTGQLIIGPGVAEVSGTFVRRDDTHILITDDWGTSVLRLPSMRYYLYITQQGEYWVDISAPEYTELKFAYYHPDHIYRYLSEFYIDVNDRIILVTTLDQPLGRTVTIASSTFVGTDYDRKCDGVDDEQEINDMITYLYETYGGGVIHLTEGIFYTSDTILLYYGVTIIGCGLTTEIQKNGDYNLIYNNGNLNQEIRDLKLSHDTSDTNYNYMIYMSSTDDLVINNVTIENPIGVGIYISGCDNFEISDTIIYEPESSSAYTYGINLNNSNGEIKNIIIDGRSEIKTTILYGIHIQNSDDIHISNVLIKNMIANAVYGIYNISGDYGFIDRVVIDNLRGVAAVDYAYGIYIYGNKWNITESKIVNIPNYNLDTGDSYDRACGIFLVNDNNQISNIIIENCGCGIYITSAGDDNRIIANQLIDNGDLLIHGNCEDSSAPYIEGDGSSTNNSSFARSSDEARYGTYSYKQTITAGGSDAEARLCDNATTTDMHELLAGYSYRLSGYAFVPSTGGPAVGEVELVFAYYDSGAWTEEVATATLQDEFEFLECATVDIPSTATGTRAFMRIQDTASNGEYVYWDDLRLRPIGIRNEHAENFDDDGSGTQIGMNSWQGVQV